MSSSPGDPESLLGQSIEAYRLEALLGMGGAGAVFAASKPDGAKIAIKIFFPPMMIGAAQREEFRQRFLREAETLSRLRHPHILAVSSFGKDEKNGFLYMLMPYMSGGTLSTQIRPGGLPFSQVLDYVQQIAAALDFAHAQNIIHRDLKPSNILIDEHDQLYLCDFGIAKLYALDMTSFTQTNQMLGTPGYMAPEQFTDQPVTRATDVYGLATITYQLLTGKLPFDVTSLATALQQIMLTEPRPPRNLRPELSPLVSDVLLRGLAKQPEARFASAGAFANALEVALKTPYVPKAVPIPASENDLPTLQSGGALALTSTPTVATSGRGPQSRGVSNPGNRVSNPGNPLAALEHFQPQQSTYTDETPFAPITPQFRNEAPAYQSDPNRNGPYRMSSTIPSSWAPTPTTVENWHAPPDRQEKSRAGLVLVIVLLIMLLLGGGSFAAYYVIWGMGGDNGRPVITAPGSATVTITADSKNLQSTFTMMGITDTPDANQHQVAARTLEVTTQTVSETVAATGSKQVAAVIATGALTFDNESVTDLNYPAGATFTAQDGVKVAIDKAVAIASPYQTGGYTPVANNPTTVPAHTVAAGSAGNIAALDIRISSSTYTNTCPTGPGTRLTASMAPQEHGWSGLTLVWPEHTSGGAGYQIICNLSAFSGGQDASNQTLVQQSDIDTASQDLITAHAPTADQILRDKLQSNEKLADNPICKPQTTSSKQAGDVSDNVTVSVSFKCTGEAYDSVTALSFAVQQLKDQAATDPGSAYTLSGNVTPTLKSTTPDPATGKVSIAVDTKGTWQFQLTDAQRQIWAAALAGKTRSAGQTFLQGQAGVKQVAIQFGDNNQSSFPNDPGKITISIQPATGA